MSIGKYIIIALVAFFFVAIALEDEEVFGLWFSTVIFTGIGYAIGYKIYTSNKAKIYVGVSNKKGAVRKAEVSVFMDDMEFRRGVTNWEGKCAFFLPTGRGYMFKAKKGNYESGEETLHISDKSMRGISLELTLRKVTVKVTGEYRPLKDAHVSARASIVSGTMSEHTDVDGGCAFTLPLGTCELIIEKDGYAPAKIQVGEDDNVATVKLEPKFVKVKVEVADELEQPVEGASVKIGKKSLVTDDRGVVDAEIRVGEQKLSVEKGDFLPFNTSLNISEDLEQRVMLKRQHGWLEVSVIDSVTGESQPANVTLLLFGSKSVEGKREEKGHVHFDEVPVGTHQVKITLEGYHEKEIPVEISEGENALKVQLEPLPALSETLLQELANVEAGLQSTVSKLSQSHDVVLPRYYQSYCLTLSQLAKRMPQGANIPAERMVGVIKEVCGEAVKIMEEKKQFYITALTKAEETVELPPLGSEFYELFKGLIKDTNSFYKEHSSRIQQRIKEVDSEITEKMTEYEIAPVTSLWKLAKKLAGMREDMVKNAICLLFAEIALDFAERMFVVEEVAERLKKK